MTLTLDLPPEAEASVKFLADANQTALHDFALRLFLDKIREEQTRVEEANMGAPETQGNASGDLSWEQYQAHFGHIPALTREEIAEALQQSAEDFAAGRSYSLEECIAHSEERRRARQARGSK